MLLTEITDQKAIKSNMGIGRNWMDFPGELKKLKKYIREKNLDKTQQKWNLSKKLKKSLDN